jgi:hypothetical protein
MRLCCAALLFTLACSSSGPSGPGEPGVAPPRIVQRSTPSGTTNFSASTGIAFEVLGGAASLAQTFASRSGFFTLDGTRAADAVTLPGAATDFLLAPATPLAADTWFELKTAAATEYGSAFDSFDGRMLFFTGSAPKIRFLRRTAQPKGVQHFMYVSLTEAARVTTIAWFDGTKQVPGCIFRDGTCQTVTTSAFDFRFDETSASFPSTTRVELDGTSYDLAPWTQCPDDADTLCWVRPIP